MGNKYYFDSFANSGATQYYGSGTVTTTGNQEGNYVEVKVTADNNHSEFVGRSFWVNKDAKTDGSEVVQLYTNNGSTETGVYVKIYEEAPKRTVSVTVKDGSDDAIQGATVVIGETTKTTGSAGGCSFTLTDGEYSATISKDGYTTKTETVTVGYDSLTVNVTLSAS